MIRLVGLPGCGWYRFGFGRDGMGIHHDFVKCFDSRCLIHVP